MKMNICRKSEYKRALKEYGDSKGMRIDALRAKYPFRICRESEPESEAVLTGVQPLCGGDEFPMYRFPGGVCCENPFSQGIKIIEW